MLWHYIRPNMSLWHIFVTVAYFFCLNIHFLPMFRWNFIGVKLRGGIVVQNFVKIITFKFYVFRTSYPYCWHGDCSSDWCLKCKFLLLEFESGGIGISDSSGYSVWALACWSGVKSVPMIWSILKDINNIENIQYHHQLSFDANINILIPGTRSEIGRLDKSIWNSSMKKHCRYKYLRLAGMLSLQLIYETHFLLMACVQVVGPSKYLIVIDCMMI